MNFLKALIPVIAFLLALSCARQTSPTGGPSDTIPPRIVRVTPDKGTTNFNTKKIDFLFNEMVDLNNPKEQIIITPSIGKDFKVTVNKQTVTIELERGLEPNTTYSINLRESVKDITEKNPSPQYQYAFSTGPYLDSLSIKGSITNLLSAEPLKEITVSVHPKNDTFNILKHPATYLTKTDKSGNFTIDYLKPGEYFLYAFDDKNRNLLVDSRTELYGFKQELINLTQDTTNQNIALVKLDARPLKITSARPYNTYFTIRASKSLSDVHVEPSDTTDQIFYGYGEDQSNIKVFNTLINKDSTLIKLTGRDSINNTLDTTLYIKFFNREITPEKFQSSITQTAFNNQSAIFSAKLTFNKPIVATNLDSLKLVIDSLNILKFNNQELTFDIQRRNLIISKLIDRKFIPVESEDNFTPQQSKQTQIKPEFISGKGAFISVENDSTPRLTQTTTPISAQSLSTIIFKVETTAPNFIIELLDKDKKVVQQLYNLKSGEFKNLQAGDYQLRVISDRNQNRTWDPGNYLNRLEPEPMIYSINQGSTKISLKASWDLEVPTVLIDP